MAYAKVKKHLKICLLYTSGLTGCGKSKEPVESNKESEVVRIDIKITTFFFIVL